MNTAGTLSQSAAVTRGYLAEAGTGAIAIIAANAAAFGVLLMLFKLAVDYQAHRAERRALAGAASPKA